MRFERTVVEAVVLIQPPRVVSSEQIEARLAPVYERLRLPAGRLELMTGIRERRFWEPGAVSAAVAARAGAEALARAGRDPATLGSLVHASVCRDYLEPATAALVHERLGLPPTCAMFDLTNACLGVLSGMVEVAAQIELGWIDAGLVVSGELAEPLHEGTMRALLSTKTPTKALVKRHFASLTIGSAAAAVVLARADRSASAHRLLGGAMRTDSSANHLCRANPDAGAGGGPAAPVMDTDSEGLLHAGCALAARTWEAAKAELGWTNETPTRVFTHQVGRAHAKLTLEALGLPETKDFPTVSFLGNTGSAALPGAWALGVEGGAVREGDRIGLLGIGSGLSSLMLGLEW